MTLRTGLCAFSLLCTLAVAPPAFAQEEEEAPAGEPVEMTEDPEPVPDLFDESGELSGAEETPDDPNAVFTEKEPEPETPTPRQIRTEYPSELVLRPLTLPAGMAEVALDIPVRVEPFSTTGVLRGSYGVTKEAQVSFVWLAGTVHEDGFETGEAIALDVRYAIFDWLAAQLVLPFYIDPFAMGVTVGAPVKFTFFDKLSFVGGADLFEFEIYRFAPELDNELVNVTFEQLDATNTALPCCRMNLIGQAIYQLDPQSAVDLRFGIRKQLETSAGFPEDTPVLLDVGYLYASSNMLDFSARAGFERLDEVESFAVQLAAAFRL